MPKVNGSAGLLAALALALGCGSAQNAASSEGPAQSGQTGSPNAEPPDYVTPAPREPGRGGGTDGETGVGESPIVLPDPGPPPSSAELLVGSTLIAPSLDGAKLFDVSDPLAPRLLSSLPGVNGVVHAASPAEVTLQVWEQVNVSSETIPDALPYYRHAVAVYDLEAAEAPVLLRELELPPGVAKSIVTDVGITLLGADLDLGEPECGEQVGELLVQPTVMGLWAEAHLDNGDQFTLATRREFEPGHWVLSKNQVHAVYVRSDAFGSVTPPFDAELIDLRTLETQLSVSLSAADLGEPWGGVLELDSYGDVVALSGGPNVLAWDLASGERLPTLALDAPNVDLSFIRGGQYLSVGGSNRLLAVDHAASPPRVSVVELAAGTSAPVLGQLQSFGDGFIAIGSSEDERLAAARYALVDGQLSQLEALTTSWPNPSSDYGPRGWEVNDEHQRVTHVSPSGDSGSGHLGILALVDDRLVASTPVSLDRAAPYPVNLQDAVIDITLTQLQPIGVEPGDSALTLDAGTPTFTAIEGVWRQLEHADILWTVHRTDTGLWSMSARASVASAPTWLELPHVVNDVRAIDDTHVAVIGLSVSGQCQAHADGGGELSECEPAASAAGAENALPFANGLSVLRVNDGQVSVVESFVLSSSLGDPPPAGVSQWVTWRNVLELSAQHWAMVGHVTRECNSVESCERLGVVPYVSLGSSAGGACPNPGECEPSSPQIQEFISGYQHETWLLPFDLTDPDAPVRRSTVQRGAPLDVHGLVNLGSPVIRGELDGAPVWAYRSVEEIYDESGNSVLDENERPIARTYLQTFRFRDGELRFDERVQVPGSVVGLSAPRASTQLDEPELTVFTAEPQFSSATDQVWVVHRLAVGDGQAWIDESLQVGEYVAGMQQTGERIGVVTAPEDACAEGARYGVLAIDTSADELSLSSALELPNPGGWGWGFSLYVPSVEESGVITVAGGPARGRGRLLVDVTRETPSIVRYETFDDYEAFEW